MVKVLIWMGGVVALAAVAACGGSPTMPTSPRPAPPPTASLRVIGEDLLLPDWPCSNGQCRYGFDFRSDGPDCATAVRGTLKLFRGDGTTQLAEDAWALDAARVVRPQEIVRVEDGPLALSAFETLAGVNESGKYRVTFAFEAVRCS